VTTAPDIDPRDRDARQLHAAALAHTSPPTLARLREARRSAAAAQARPRWPALTPWLAGGAVAALGLAVVLQPGLFAPAPVTPSTPATATVSVAVDPGADAAFAAGTGPDVAGPLQEDPGFYVWLDSVDANALAME
jgi:hypothetical protein